MFVACAIAADQQAWARCGTTAHLNTVDVHRLTGYSDKELYLMPTVYMVYENGRLGFSFQRTSMPPCRGPECESRQVPVAPDLAVVPRPSGGAHHSLLVATEPVREVFCGRDSVHPVLSGSLLSGYLMPLLRPPIAA